MKNCVKCCPFFRKVFLEYNGFFQILAINTRESDARGSARQFWTNLLSLLWPVLYQLVLDLPAVEQRLIREIESLQTPIVSHKEGAKDL